MNTPQITTTRDDWRDIPGFPFYQVNSIGQVRSQRAHRGRLNKWRTLRPSKHKGYLWYDLADGNGMRRKGGHQLVLLAFVGPCPEGMEACHENDVKDDNRLENLRWDTHGGNYQDQVKHGTARLRRGGVKDGPGRPQKFQPSDIVEIFQLYATGGYSQVSLARELKVQPALIGGILRREVWKHVEIPSDLLQSVRMAASRNLKRAPQRPVG